MSTHPQHRLGDRYEIFAELSHDDHAVTYPARHRTLDREVSITVLRASTPAERNLLGVIAADARILGAIRDEHILPVLDTQWLSDNELAIVRPRVKGTSLRQVIEGAGTLSPKRTEELLREIGGTLEWSSRNGVVHRYLNPDSICLLQGSKKVLVAFGPPVVLDAPGKGEQGPAAPAPTPTRMLRHCTDANTLATLAWTMLTGHEPTRTEGSLRHLRPEVSPAMAEVVDEGLRCDGERGMMPLASFLARLGGTGSSPREAGVASRSARPSPVMDRAVIPPPTTYPPAPQPAGRKPGFGMRVGMALLVLAVIAIAAWAAMQRSAGDRSMARARRDTGSAAGDVALPRREAPAPRTDSAPRPQTPARTQAGAGNTPAQPSTSRTGTDSTQAPIQDSTVTP